MSRTDRILAAIHAELERYRLVLDTEPGLSAVSVTVRFDRHGHPRVVLLRPEMERDLRAHPVPDTIT